MSNRTVAYLRVSTERQVDGNGLAQQRQSICAYGAATGLKIDDWVTDDETGTTEEREGIQQLLSGTDIGTIVFDRIDRLGRTLLVAESLFAKFRAKGVRLLCVSQQLEDSPPGQLIRQIMSAFAEYQRSEMLVRLAQCKRAAKAGRGTYGGGSVAYGFRPVGNGKLALDAGTAPIVRRAHALATERPELSLREIAAELTADGLRTRKGTVISATQVKRILDRAAVYKGEQNVGKVPLEAGVKPVHEVLLGKNQKGEPALA